MAKDWSYTVSVTRKIHKMALPSKAAQIQPRFPVFYYFSPAFYTSVLTPFLCYLKLDTTFLPTKCQLDS